MKRTWMPMVVAALVALAVTAGGCGIVMDQARSALLDSTLAGATVAADAAKAGSLSTDQATAALAANAGAAKTLADAPWYQCLANPTYSQYLKQSAALMVAASTRAQAGKLTLPMADAYLQAEAEMLKQIKDATNGVATQPAPVTLDSATVHRPEAPAKPK